MAAHMGRDYAIAVENEEGGYGAEDFCWNPADRSERIQRRANACVYSVNRIFDLGNLGVIKVGPGTRLSGAV